MLVVDRSLFEISVGGHFLLNCVSLLGWWNWLSLRWRDRNNLLLLLRRDFGWFVLSREVQGMLRFHETWTHHLLWVWLLKIGVHQIMENLVHSLLLRCDIQWVSSTWTLRSATSNYSVRIIACSFALGLFGSCIVCTKCWVSHSVWRPRALGRICWIIDLFQPVFSFSLISRLLSLLIHFNIFEFSLKFKFILKYYQQIIL